MYNKYNNYNKCNKELQASIRFAQEFIKGGKGEVSREHVKALVDGIKHHKHAEDVTYGGLLAGKDDNRSWTLALMVFFLTSDEQENHWPDLEIEPENQENGSLLMLHPAMQQSIKNLVGPEEYAKLHLPNIEKDFPVLKFMLSAVQPVDHRGKVHKRIDNKKQFLNPTRYKQEKEIEDFQETLFDKGFHTLPTKIKAIYEEIKYMNYIN